MNLIINIPIKNLNNKQLEVIKTEIIKEVKTEITKLQGEAIKCINTIMHKNNN